MMFSFDLTFLLTIFEGSRLKVVVLGARISPFLSCMNHKNRENCVNLIFFLLEQTYLVSKSDI